MKILGRSLAFISWWVHEAESLLLDKVPGYVEEYERQYNLWVVRQNRKVGGS